jgi:hypothetical protein
VKKIMERIKSLQPNSAAWLDKIRSRLLQNLLEVALALKSSFRGQWKKKSQWNEEQQMWLQYSRS